MVYYGTINNAFSGLCRIKNGNLDCMTDQQRDEGTIIFIIGLTIIYLIYYRLTN